MLETTNVWLPAGIDEVVWENHHLNLIDSRKLL